LDILFFECEKVAPCGATFSVLLLDAACRGLPVEVLPIGVLPDAALRLHREDCQGQKQFFCLKKRVAVYGKVCNFAV